MSTSVTSSFSEESVLDRLTRFANILRLCSENNEDASIARAVKILDKLAAVSGYLLTIMMIGLIITLFMDLSYICVHMITIYCVLIVTISYLLTTTIQLKEAVSEELLRSSGIGKVVSVVLRKHPHADISERASALRTAWMAMVVSSAL